MTSRNTEFYSLIAYNAVVRFMMQKNPHFRLLALTATPGKDAEVVQAVVDSLHIGHIEVRTDESFDIRQYIHEKVCSPASFKSSVDLHSCVVCL